jgi:Cysteine synthase
MIDKEGYVETGLEAFNGLEAIGTRLIPVAEDESELSAEVPIEQLGFYDNVIGDSARVYTDLLELLERDVPTPLLRIKSLSSNTVTVWAKLEWYHPLSLSIKDRIAWYMVKRAREHGLLQAERIYEATSTNTGLGIVGIANYLGLKTRVYLPITAQHCVDYLFEALGSEVVRVPT